MNRLAPTDAPLRSAEAVRASIDLKLGTGSVQHLAEVPSLLSLAERAGWVLGELYLSLVDRRFHRWTQTWAQHGSGIDGPAVIAALAEAGHALNPRAAALLRWTSEHCMALRRDELDEPLFSVVPEVWLGAWDDAKAFATQLLERWPEHVDPLSLPSVPSTTRPTIAAVTPGARFPHVRVGFTEAARDCSYRVNLAAGSTVIETLALALWEGGASDAELTEFNTAYGTAERDLPERITQWLWVDGRPADAAQLELLRGVLHPLRPLERWLKVDQLSYPVLIIVDALAPMESLLEDSHHAWVKPTPERDFLASLKAALRDDPNELLVDEADLSSTATQPLLAALHTGHAVIVRGHGPRSVELARHAEHAGLHVLWGSTSAR